MKTLGICMHCKKPIIRKKDMLYIENHTTLIIHNDINCIIPMFQSIINELKLENKSFQTVLDIICAKKGGGEHDKK